MTEAETFHSEMNGWLAVLGEASASVEDAARCLEFGATPKDAAGIIQQERAERKLRECEAVLRVLGPQIELADITMELSTETEMTPEDIRAAADAHPQFASEIFEFAYEWHMAIDEPVVSEAAKDLWDAIYSLQKRSFVLSAEGNSVHAVKDNCGGWLSFYEVVAVVEAHVEAHHSTTERAQPSGPS